jgi:hypothetical protein
MEQTHRQRLESYLVHRALESDDFRERLLADPKDAIERETGLRFPETVSVVVHEEKLSELHVVLPFDLVTCYAALKVVLPEKLHSVELAVGSGGTADARLLGRTT